MQNVKRAGKPFGASIGVNYDVARFWMERGASFLSIGFPQDYYMTLGKEVIQNIVQLRMNGWYRKDDIFDLCKY